jgi:hypothetical protein
MLIEVQLQLASSSWLGQLFCASTLHCIWCGATTRTPGWNSFFVNQRFTAFAAVRQANQLSVQSPLPSVPVDSNCDSPDSKSMLPGDPARAKGAGCMITSLEEFREKISPRDASWDPSLEVSVFLLLPSTDLLRNLSNFHNLRLASTWPCPLSSLDSRRR